jgi:hypothetical protein
VTAMSIGQPENDFFIYGRDFLIGTIDWERPLVMKQISSMNEIVLGFTLVFNVNVLINSATLKCWFYFRFQKV